MTLKAFLVDALTSALDLGIGTPDDIVRHVTPDILGTHLPRPLWARLLTACLGASHVDAQLVVETIGLPNLCEHVPASIMWLCVRDIGTRAIGRTATATSQSVAATAASSAPPSVVGEPRTIAATPRSAVLAPPPDERPAPPPASSPAPVAVGPAIPPPAVDTLDAMISELDSDAAAPAPSSESRMGGLRPRSPTSQRFRPSSTSSARLGAARRPQAAASPTPAASPSPSSSVAASPLSGRPRRDPTELEDEIDTRVGDGSSEWGGGGGSNRAISVDDSQLVDWQATTDGGTALSDEDFSDLDPKR